MNTTATYPNLKRTRKYASTAKSSYTVFIVEDNHTSRMILENHLKKMPNVSLENKPSLDIFPFENGEECIAALNIKPDIIILDFYLDEVDTGAENGLSVLKAIREKSPNSKVIMMSGQENVMVTAELYNKGASDYISKEHYGIVRVTQSVLRLINEIEIERKEKNKNLLISLLLLTVGFVLGYLIAK